MIPKIIHQTWKTKDVPKITIPWIESWKRLNPDWEYRFWTDEDNLKLCQEEFPELLDIYTSYQFDIQRADVARYMILCRHGGLYADIDAECIKSFNDVIDNDYLIFKWINIITNYLIAAHKNSGFFKFVLTKLNDSTMVFTGRNKKSFVLRTTGPVFLYACYREYFKEYVFHSPLEYTKHNNIASWVFDIGVKLK